MDNSHHTDFMSKLFKKSIKHFLTNKLFVKHCSMIDTTWQMYKPGLTRNLTKVLTNVNSGTGDFMGNIVCSFSIMGPTSNQNATFFPFNIYTMCIEADELPRLGCSKICCQADESSAAKEFFYLVFRFFVANMNKNWRRRRWWPLFNSCTKFFSGADWRKLKGNKPCVKNRRILNPTIGKKSKQKICKSTVRYIQHNQV